MSQIKSYLRNFWRYRTTKTVVELSDAVFYISLSLVVLAAFLIRIMPARFGAYINEFDPYLQYYATKVIVSSIKERGLGGVFSFFSHHIDLTWYPYGVDLGQKYYPGVPYIGALTYLFLSAIGLQVSLYDVAVFVPVLFGVFSVLIVYKIAYRISGSRYTGLFAALFYGLAPSVILRSNLGWYDTDGLGMTFLLLSIYLYLKSMDSPTPTNKAFYSFLSGASLGILGATWGIHQYIYVLIAVLTILIVVLDIDVNNYEAVYFPFVLTSFIFLNSVPVNRLGYIIGFTALIQYLAILLLVMRNVVDIKLFTRHISRVVGVTTFIGVSALVIISLLPSVGLPSRHIIVALPFMREAFVVATTVQEQLKASFFTYFRDIHILAPFTIIGFYISLKNWRSPKYLLIVIGALSSLYASSSFVRLTIVFDIFAVILAAVAFQHIYKFFVDNLEVRSQQFKLYTFSFVALFLVLSSSMIYMLTISPLSRSPVALVQHGTQFSSNPVSYDWIQALEWIKNNVGDDEVIASWWDYGYWISFIAGKKSLADNGTLNSTRIQELATMFMSTDEKTALKILKSMNASYILVYIGSVQVNENNPDLVFFAGTGEDGKFVAIAKIAGVNRSLLINEEDPNKPRLTDYFWSTFLGKLIPYEYQTQQNLGRFSIDIYRYSPKYPEIGSDDSNSPLVLVFRSSDPAPGEIVIYKINYSALKD